MQAKLYQSCCTARTLHAALITAPSKCATGKADSAHFLDVCQGTMGSWDCGVRTWQARNECMAQAQAALLALAAHIGWPDYIIGLGLPPACRQLLDCCFGTIH